MPSDLVNRLLLEPVSRLDEAMSLALGNLSAGARVGVMAWANATIPALPDE
jgi:hypothetical protein